jgi:hypothetical protein
MLNIVKFKGCKRCGGDLFLERDDDGVYITCLQCSAVYYRRIDAEKKPAKAKSKKVYAH